MIQDSHLSDGTFVVVDVETTGLNPIEDRITEIAMMKVKNGVLLDEFSTLINPLVSIPASITNLTGIDNLMVADAPTAREVAPTIADFLGNAIFVAHNAQFDWGFVSQTTMRERGIELNNSQLCTVKLSRIILPHLPSKSLGPVTTALNITIPERHRASGDAYATALVLVKFISYVQRKHDIHLVSELLRFQNGWSPVPSK
ncbi:MAG: 3'-5' exonuclease [Ignavibacteriales bacterium]|nr:3'-5' exonuclease [Ignavibacteriales bacterium]